ncbi:hypothetical protein ACQEU3_13545 [Spirillospora sp. CA-253888]
MSRVGWQDQLIFLLFCGALLAFGVFVLISLMLLTGAVFEALRDLWR